MAGIDWVMVQRYAKYCGWGLLIGFVLYRFLTRVVWPCVRTPILRCVKAIVRAKKRVFYELELDGRKKRFGKTGDYRWNPRPRGVFDEEAQGNAGDPPTPAQLARRPSLDDVLAQSLVRSGMPLTGDEDDFDEFDVYEMPDAVHMPEELLQRAEAILAAQAAGDIQLLPGESPPRASPPRPGGTSPGGGGLFGGGSTPGSHRRDGAKNLLSSFASTFLPRARSPNRSPNESVAPSSRGGASARTALGAPPRAQATTLYSEGAMEGIQEEPAAGAAPAVASLAGQAAEAAAARLRGSGSTELL